MAGARRARPPVRRTGDQALAEVRGLRAAVGPSGLLAPCRPCYPQRVQARPSQQRLLALRGGSCNRRAGRAGLPTPGVTLDLGLRALVSLNACPGQGSAFPGAAAKGAQPRLLARCPERSCQCKISGPDAAAASCFQSSAGRSLGAATTSRGSSPGPPSRRASVGPRRGRRFGAPGCSNSAFWETPSRAPPSGHPCEGMPIWKLGPAPSSLLHELSLCVCCRPGFMLRRIEVP